VRDQQEQGLVGGPTDGRGRDVGAEDAVDDAVDVVGPASGSQTDGEAGLGVSQDAGTAA
jgi:hypothetical protein